MPTTIPFPVLTIDGLAPALVKHFDHAAEWQDGYLPTGPGVYAWSSSDGAVLYIGSAARLSRRVGDEERWIDGHDPETMWQVTVVHQLKHFEAIVRWISVETPDAAKQLERRLVEWHRACVGSAPPLVGWDAKANTPAGDAQQWARELWESGRQPIQDR